MDHATYLDRFHELTTAALSELALMMGREEFTAATEYLTALRAQQDALYEQHRAWAAQRVNP